MIKMVMMIRIVMTPMKLREGDNGVILKMMVVILMTTLWCCLMMSKSAAAIKMEMVMKIKTIIVNFPGGSYRQGT